MTKKQAKKRLSLIFLMIFFVIAVVCGYFVARHITRNDVFEIIGEKEITISIGESYQDEGARAISFGRDITDKIKSESTVNNEVAGSYYIKYTVDDIRYNGVARYRVIIVVDPNAETSEVSNENN